MSNIRRNKRIKEGIRVNVIAFSLLSLTVIMGYSVSPYRFDGDMVASLQEDVAQLSLEIEQLEQILLEANITE